MTGGSAAAAPARRRSTICMLFPTMFVGDILTDFPFIEASFGLSIAGVVM